MSGHGQTVQPYVIIESPTIQEIHKAYVVIDCIRYEFDSVRRAIDICFKSFHVMNAKYPLPSSHIWQLIQKCVYGISTPSDIIIPQIVALTEQLQK